MKTETVHEVENKNLVPTFVYESMSAAHQHEKELLIKVIGLITILCILLAGIVGYGVHELFQYDKVEYSYSQDGEGTNIIGNGNEVRNGSEAENPDHGQTQR